jgi:glycine oxidase
MMDSDKLGWDSLVVGGGVIGLSLAWELAGRGKRVCLVDAGEIGQAASWAGAGILPPSPQKGAVDPYEQLKALSHALHPQWADRLREETGIDTGYQRCGGLYLAVSPAEAATLAANSLWWSEHGIEFECWTGAQLLQEEPNLNRSFGAGPASAWYLPDECQLRNPRHLKALVAACKKRGVGLLANTPMDELQVKNGKVTGIQANGRVLQAEQVCISTGAWARSALQRLGFETGIMPVRGQMVLYRCPRTLLARVINDGNRYLVPRADGRLLAGSVEEEVGYVVETTEDVLRQIRTWAERLVPTLAQCEVERSWAGLRPGSYDGFPYLGKVPSIEGLFVAAGHYRSGLHLSCATAVVMADAMFGQPNNINLHPFRLGR